MANNTLRLIGSKLGFSGDHKVLNKAEELHRILQTKSTAGSNLTDGSKMVLCLDIAADILGLDLDIKSAIKYSGLKLLAYKNTKKVLENLLEVNVEQLTTKLLCATQQCSQVQELADQILEEYRRQVKMEVNLDLPQYVCMAVYHACRISKVKLSKSKFIDKSRLKPAQWTKLDAEWTKFVELHFADKKKKGRQSKAIVENVDSEDKMEVDVSKQEDNPQDIVEPYDDWKRRMLETAYAELKEFEINNNPKTVTPRKSPRKCVQKFSPYKSPNKTDANTKGVRLLFATDM